MLKVKIWEEIFHKNTKQKRRGVALLLLLLRLWPLTLQGVTGAGCRG